MGTGQGSQDEAWKDDYPTTRVDEPSNGLIGRVQRVLAVPLGADVDVRDVLGPENLFFMPGTGMQNMGGIALNDWLANVY